MRHIGPIAAPRAAPPRSLWRFFPWYVAVGLVIVLAVNFTMSYLAIRTFPGQVTDRGFANSNGYNEVLAAAARQEALGWSVVTGLSGGRPVLRLSGRDGAPLRDPQVTAIARRPLGDPTPVPLELEPTAPGRFETEMALPPGAWDVELAVVAEDGAFHAIRRLVVEP